MKQHDTYTDEELLRQFRHTGNNEWLGILLQRHTMLLLGVAFKYLKDQDHAADAVQQVFLKTMTSLPDGEIQNFKGWLYILMRNHCFQFLRDRKHHHSDDSLYNHTEPATPDVKTLREQEEEIDLMKEALHELEEGQRTCITMFYLHKKTYQQIMEEKGFSFMQVKSFIQNGKRRLRTIMNSKRSTK